VPWSSPFDEPIRLRGGRQLTTLQQAADYIMKLPEDVQRQERWQIAVEPDQCRGDRRWLADVCADRGDAGAQWRRTRALTAVSIREPGATLDIAALFQRRIYRSEVGVEGAADAVDGGDDHNADAGGDQAIFDRGGAGIIIQEF